jgi:serine/threonine protein kinase
MRFIKGDSLQHAIERFHNNDRASRHPGERALALRQLLRRFIDVCNAVAYAHSRGVLHRDLKPDNLMLGQYGETLVVDWGLAKPLGHRMGKTETGERTLLPHSPNDPAATQMGSAIGTPAYMSPEQAAGRLDELGTASDVYSLGATLYCLLTGKPPIEGRDAGLVLRRVQTGNFPPPSQVKPSVPAALEAICLKAMALQPGDLYVSARGFADDIERWLADEPVSACRETILERLGRWARRHRAWTQTGAVGLLFALVVSVTATIVVYQARLKSEERQRLLESAGQEILSLAAENKKLAAALGGVASAEERTKLESELRENADKLKSSSDVFIRAPNLIGD